MSTIPVTIKVVDMLTGKIKETLVANEWEIDMDTIATTNSTFTLDTFSIATSIGDFIIVEQMGDPHLFHWETECFLDGGSTHVTGVIVPLYIGVIMSYEEYKLTAYDLRRFAYDTKGAEMSFTGANAGDYLIDGVFTKFFRLAGKQINYCMDFYTVEDYKATGWTRTISSPEVKNCLDILNNIQTTYSTIVQALGYRISNGAIRFMGGAGSIATDPYTQIGTGNGKREYITIDLSNHDKYPADKVDVYVRDAVVSGVNTVAVIDKTNVNNQSIWYMQDDGNVKKDGQANMTLVHKPLVIDVAFADIPDGKTWANLVDADFLKVVNPLVSKDRYAHQITFTYNLPQGKADRRLFTIGQPVHIKYKNKKYDSYITGFKMGSEEDTVTISCGNIRSDLASRLQH